MTPSIGEAPGKTRDDSVRPFRFWSLLPWHLLILLAISFQYPLAWRLTPEATVFSGALQNPDDLSAYIAAMRQGAAGEWLFHFTYSPEAWQPRLMLLLYLALGKVTTIFAPPDALWLHLWRILLSGLTLWFILFWVNTVLPSAARWQRTAWFLIWFGGGISWFLALFWPSIVEWVPDIGVAEWSPIGALFNTPHYALGLGLEALTFAYLLKAIQANGAVQWRWSLVGPCRLCWQF